MNNQDTICAISTAPGIGGIAVIRISGDRAIEICDKIFVPVNNGKNLKEKKAYSLSFGNIIDDKGQTIDEVIVAVFKAPHSFTGEDTIEISCHGSIYIQQKILQTLIEQGARMATAGEFTQRAFINAKMDLSQAEAVADLIASTSAATHKIAMNQMKGSFSKELTNLRNELLTLTSLVELELDFSEEEVEFADRKHLSDLADKIYLIIKNLSDSFKLGNAIKKGIPVAIIGETNAGKSTILNLLLHEEKAIVSDIHGTTRDVIEDTIVIDGITFRFIDTAGIRDTKDKIENLGIERTYQKLEQASIILWVIDASAAIEEINEVANKVLPKITDQKVILVFNKIDKISSTKDDNTAINACQDGTPSLLGNVTNDDTVAIDTSPDKSSNIYSNNTNGDTEAIETCHDKSPSHYGNDADIEAFETVKNLENNLSLILPQYNHIYISAKNNINTKELEDLLVRYSEVPEIGSNDVIVTNMRHYEALKNALSSIERVKDGLVNQISGDFLSQDIRECIHYLGEITGEINTDEILGTIFGKFCIGK